MSNLTGSNYLNVCLSTYPLYTSDARCMYESCNFGTRIAVMMLANGTEHNENRYNILNRKTARYRASSVQVLCVFNKFNPTETFESGTSNFAGVSIEYKVGEVVSADYYNTNIAKEDSNGLFYFRCLEGAYFYGLLGLATYSGDYFEWHYNGKLKEVGQLVNGKREGKFENFYKNGQKCTVCYYTTNKLNGDYFKWFENGNKSLRGNYVNDIPVGPFISWHTNGVKYYEGCYNDEGQETGVWISWDESGCRNLFCTYKEGKYDGIYIKYVQGSLNSVETAGEYKKGFFHVYDLGTVPKFVL